MFHYMHKVLMQTVQMKGIARDEPISGLGHQWVVEFEIDVICIVFFFLSSATHDLY